MYETIIKTIQQYENKGDFTHVDVSEEMIGKAEKILGYSIPEQYKWFLIQYGHGGLDGIEILGYGINGKALFVDETLFYRKYGLEDKFIVVEKCDEWTYCIDCDTQKIIIWNQSQAREVYGSFVEYFSDRMQDAIDNMEF